MTKKFYDHDAMKRIEILSGSGKAQLAYKEMLDYMAKYPNDNFSHIVNAEILLQLGKPEEALEEIEYYMHEPMHGYLVETSIYTTYGSILLALGRFEEGIESLKKAIADHKSYHKHETCSALNRLYKHYISTKQIDEALELLNSCKATPAVQVKKAQTYIIKSDFYKAIEILSNLNENSMKDQDKVLGHYYYLYGKVSYFLKDYDNATYYLQKCIDGNEAYAMKALSYLGHIECIKLNTNKAIKYGLEIVSKKTFYSHGYELLARAYTESNNFEAAAEAIEHIEDFYWKLFRQARLHFAKQDFVNAEIAFTKLLNCNVEKFFEENLNYYILCLFRQGKYKEVLYTMDCVQSQGMKQTHDMEMMRVYIDSLNHVKLEMDKLSYSAKQVYQYNPAEAIKHIISHHVMNSRMSELNDKDIRRIYEDVYSKLNINNAIPDSYFDKHVFYYKDVGISIPEEKDENQEVINQLEVITLPGTKEILTMYPRKGTDAFLDEKNQPDNKTKRLSQIDKFNKKYGLK